jgi:hypothetical protein
MTIHRVFVLGVAPVLPQPGGAQLIPTEVFARFEGVLDFYAKAAPKDSGKYEKLRKELVKGAPEKYLLETRKTQEYKGAYEQVKLELSKMPADKAIKACSAPLEDSH